MKKLIVFSAIVALLAPAVFAEVGVGAWARGTVNVIEGDTVEKDKDKEKLTGSGSHEMRAEFSGENDEGTFGAHFKMWNNYDSGNSFGWVWWKPIDQFQLQIGHNQWAWFEFRPLVAWGFYEAACDAQVVDEKWKFGNAFYGGFGDAGATVSIYPVEGMAINLGLPYQRMMGDNHAFMQDILYHLHAQFSYNISDVGTLAISYQGGPDSLEMDLTNPDSGFGYDSGKIYAAFELSAVENIGLSFGVGYTVGAKILDDDDKAIDDSPVYNPPVYAGVGFSFGGDGFGFKARAMGGFGGNFEWKAFDVKTAEGTSIVFDILPYFDLGIMNLYIAAGLDMYLPSSDEKDAGQEDATVGFYFNPYITKSVGPGTFFAGVRVESDGSKDADDKTIIKFKVPIAIIFGF